MDTQFNITPIANYDAMYKPRRGTLSTADNYATITAAGYLNKKTNEQVETGDFVFAYYGTGINGIFVASVAANGVITLNDFSSAGEVSLIGTATLNHIPAFADTSGNIKDSSAKIVGTTFTNLGHIVAGESGSAGSLYSFPTTAAKGSLRIRAADNNAADAESIIQNGQVAQATTYTLPVPPGATATLAAAPSALVSGNFVKASGTGGLLVDSGLSFKTISGAVAGGGSATQNIADAFCTSNSVVLAAWNTSANAVSIQKIVPGNGSFDVISSGNAGAGTLNYIIINGVVP